MPKCPMCDYDNIADNIYCGQCGYRLGTGAGSSLNQALYKIKTANLKSVIGTAGLLLLLFAAGFGIANSALFLAMGGRQDNRAALEDTTGAQPVKKIAPEQNGVQESFNQEDQEEIQTENQTESQEASQEENKTEDNSGKKKGQFKKKIDYKKYQNKRFGFSIDYPRDFEKGEPPANGDGMVFTSPDGQAKLMAFGSNNPEGSSLQDVLQASKKSAQTEIAYQKVGSSYFVLSWQKDSSIYYLKSFVGRDSTNTFIFSYPRDEKDYYDPITIHLEPSFKPGALQ